MDDSVERLHGREQEVNSSDKYRLVEGWTKARLDNAIAQTDNDDQDPGDGSLGAAHDLRGQDEALGGLACAVNVLILRGEHGLLHHPQENDSSDPELESQDLSPVQRADQ